MYEKRPEGHDNGHRASKRREARRQTQLSCAWGGELAVGTSALTLTDLGSHWSVLS